jgi:hypothetical protein
MHRIKTVRSQTGAFVCLDRNVALHKSNFTLYGKHVKAFLVQRNISVIETTKDPVWEMARSWLQTKSDGQMNKSVIQQHDS